MPQCTTDLILNNKTLFSHRSGGQEPRTEVLTGHLKVSEGFREECSLASSSFWGLPALLGVPCGSVALIGASLPPARGLLPWVAHRWASVLPHGLPVRTPAAG